MGDALGGAIVPRPARRRRRSCVTLAVAVLVLATSCTRGVEAPRSSDAPAASTAPAPTSPTSSASPSTPSLTSVTIEAPRRGSLLVRGTYPPRESECVDAEQPRLLARYPGTLVVERSDDGTLALTLTLPFRAYLEGIAEVPASWPMAALEAQAIAARSYALASIGWDGRDTRAPICSTSACQVYRGIPLEPTPDASRWYRAVRATEGEVLVYGGRPAQTFYFSTSNGQTYGNEDVFGGDPLPYLRPRTELDDGDSPTSRWRSEIRSRDLARFLARAGLWPSGTPIADVRLQGTEVVVAGAGTTRTMSVGDFRDGVNAWAHCLEPRRYPRGGLPTTIPSRWLSISAGERSVVVSGRGWGHGVGLVQWGAYGKARRGLSAAEILSFYYGGFRPERFPEPETIRVEVVSGLTSLRLVPSEPGARVNGTPVGRGRVVVTGGETLTLETP